MIERASEFGASQAAPLIPGDSTDKTAGDLLREAREAHGLHIDMVAAALKVPTRKLQALEDNDIDALPDPVFARALAASVCRALRVDPAPVLAKLPGALRPGLADADRSISSSSFRSGAPRSRAGNGTGSPSRAALVAVGLLLAGAAALFWLPTGAFERLGSWAAALTNRAAPNGPEAAPPVAAGIVIEPSATLAAPPEPAPAPAPAPATTASSPAAQAEVAPSAPSAEALVFVVRADSWITVNDAAGKPLLRRTVRAGETVAVNGALPLSVVVGRSAGVEVRVRGKAFDLTPLARTGGTARFEVKP